MKYSLQGTTMQILTVELEKNEKIVSESSRMVYMSDNIKMETKMKRGFWSAVKRTFAGESFFLVDFISKGGTGIIGFGTEFPGKIIPVKLKKGKSIIAQKDAFLCSEESVTFDSKFVEKIGSALLGGEGIFLMKVQGSGYVFFNVGGEVTEIDLKKEQKIRIDTGNLAMFEEGMEYNVERVTGVKNIIWGGEGLFLATISGPGKVWIQSMPVQELAKQIDKYIVHPEASR